MYIFFQKKSKYNKLTFSVTEENHALLLKISVSNYKFSYFKAKRISVSKY